MSLACERKKEEKSPCCSVYPLEQMNQGVVKGQGCVAHKDCESLEEMDEEEERGHRMLSIKSLSLECPMRYGMSF